MTAARRALLALAALLLLAFLGLAVALPRIAASERVRALLVDAVQGAAKRPFSYRALGAGLVPPRLVLEDAVLAGAGDEPAARARRVELRLALLPLLARAVVVRSLAVEDAALSLVRDDAGVRLAGADLAEPPKPPREGPSEPSQRRGFDLAVQRLALRGVDVRLEDARPGGAPPFELRDVEGEASARSPDAPVELALRAVADGSGNVAARGPLALRASTDARASEGTFELDATEAELAFEAWLRKPAGTVATARGSFRRTRGAEGRSLRLDGVELALADLRAKLDAELAPRRRVVADAPPFDARALAALVPALARRELSGSVALEGLTVESAPLSVRGRVRLDALGLGGEGPEALLLRGALEGLGDELVGRDLRARVGGSEAPVELRVHGLAAKPRFTVAAKLEGADAGAVVAAFGGKRDAIEGPLDLDARLEGRLGGRRSLLATLSGHAALRIAPGRLRGVALLRTALDTAARVGEPAAGDSALERAAGAAERARDDRFESLAGRFDVARGVARTDDLRLAYPDYAVELRGSVGLADRALDLTAALAVAPAAGTPGARGRSVPLASVGGTLDAPKVELTRAALAGAASAYARDERRRRKWEDKLDERLGEGEGGKVLEALDKVLESLERPEGEGGKPGKPAE